MALYEFAHDENNNLIHISSVEKSNRKEHSYKCLFCHDDMRPRLGQVREHHFYHSNAACSYESYIHKLGKELFHKEYLKCVEEKTPFMVDIVQKSICSLSDKCIFHKGNCMFDEKVKTIDLTKYFPKISMPETADGEFIPDLFIENDKGDKIYIEIYFTSRCSEKKITSGTKIIEIRVKDCRRLLKSRDTIDVPTELSDNGLAEISAHHLTIKTIECYNFKDILVDPKETECGANLMALLLYESGKRHIEKYSAVRYVKRKISKKEIYSEAALLNEYSTIEPDKETFAAICLSNAYECGVRISHCKLCKHCMRSYNNTLHRLQNTCELYGSNSFDEKMYIYNKCKEFEADESKISTFKELRNNISDSKYLGFPEFFPSVSQPTLNLSED